MPRLFGEAGLNQCLGSPFNGGTLGCSALPRAEPLELSRAPAATPIRTKLDDATSVIDWFLVHSPISSTFSFTQIT